MAASGGGSVFSPRFRSGSKLPVQYDADGKEVEVIIEIVYPNTNWNVLRWSK